MRFRQAALAAILAVLCSCSGTTTHRLVIAQTGDVHGSWFSESYTGGRPRTSLQSVSRFVDSLRRADGKDNVLLIDAGDCLQGDNAAYYFNYVRPDTAHLFPRIASYMGYDAMVVGNHDIETGHGVYDRVAAELSAAGIPWLGGNARKPDDGKPYFPVSAVFRKAGLKVAVLGFDNANIKAWLSEELWSGMTFSSLVPLVQEEVDKVVRKEKPQVVVVAVHSGTGEGDGSMLENQGLDLFNSLHGVDVLICAHDHRPYEINSDRCVMVNSGSRASYIGVAEVEVKTKGRKILEKNLLSYTKKLNRDAIDEKMEAEFRPDFCKVKAFTLQPVGQLGADLFTRDAYVGTCPYMDLVHTVQLGVPEASISFAAPLTFNGKVSAGEMVYNDMFTIYPYENQLFVVKMKGSEVKSYLESSYDGWIQAPGEHLLRIAHEPDPRTGAARWSFTGRSYNFDSAAGINYDVDITRPAGDRVLIRSMADGSPFNPDAEYGVAMTSYRANGGGGLLQRAGVDTDAMDARTVARYPEIRELIYEFIKKNPVVDGTLISDRAAIGEWKFVPEKMAAPMLKADMDLLF